MKGGYHPVCVCARAAQKPSHHICIYRLAAHRIQNADALRIANERHAALQLRGIIFTCVSVCVLHVFGWRFPGVALLQHRQQQQQQPTISHATPHYTPTSLLIVHRHTSTSWRRADAKSNGSLLRKLCALRGDGGGSNGGSTLLRERA